MSMLNAYVCQTCFGYTGYPGHAARANPGRKHLACNCPSDAELDLRDKLETDLRFTMELQRKRA